MVRRGSIVAERLSSSSLKELVKEYALRNNKAGREDFVRLLCAYLLHSLFFPAGTTVNWVYLERVEDLVLLRNYDWCGAIVDQLMMSIRQHHDDPRRVSRCVVVLLYWLCEHTNLVKPLHPEESLDIIKWRTMDLGEAFRDISLNELEANQVVSRQPKVHDTNMASGNIDNGDAGKAGENIVNEGGDGSEEHDNGTECSKRTYALMTCKKGDSARMRITEDSVHTVQDFLKNSSVHTGYCAEIASRICCLRDSGPSIEYIGNPMENDQKTSLIGELRDQIAKMNDRMKQMEDIHAREISIKDKKIESLDETVLVLLSENSQLWDQLTETAVHEMTQKYRATTPEDQERSMITRLRVRMRKDTKKEEYEYGRKRKRPTSESSRVNAEVDPKGVIDVENFIAGPEKGPLKPKPIRNLRANAVHRLLSSEEKAKIKKMWEKPILGKIQHLMSYQLTMLGCKCTIERRKILERMMPQTASYRYLLFPIHFGYHWTLLVLDNEEGSWKFYNSVMERTGVDAHCKAAEQLVISFSILCMS
ncbi:hypothetical protein RHMOL_Rhmol01G0223200 [Rhododendron molle]|uniref:Uncharacterized protein n=1 Tax=Rhododendron molle TaxID=49168 RepID=A0ACC0Q649_RHOML|nr:hypothetical protein RHMOL_Rhmol01G0223200 [Rhododendron molle]